MCEAVGCWNISYGATMNSDYWMNGRCSTFAVAFQRRFGGELWAIVNHSRKYPTDDELYHCFCVLNGVAWDAEGPHPLEEASDTSKNKWPIPEMDRDNDVVFLWKIVNEEWLEHIHDGYNLAELQAATKYIDQLTGSPPYELDF
jgi:hypothetical protein